ncbi:DUF2721 domain-containing protein [Hymenobacter terricola]|uniref:DUF2721 domain-containing protein n=1 Tax=Hymenobacter terricola TaxID=2819236 RepID=UPI001B309A10|nr:DUF2721 domain-containing protein [Hymenobacter terricola]
MPNLSDTLTILSAMFTPAVLVSACGSLILTTSQRLSRSIERQRDVAKQLRHQQRHAAAPDPAEHTHLRLQLSFAARRARLLQQSMTILHLTLAVFIASICTIGIFELVNSSATWIIAVLSVLGSGLLLYASVLLIRESRLALSDVAEETTYLTKPE